MQPYQEADLATRKSGELPLNAIKYGAGIALGAGSSMAASNIIGRVIPLLNSFIPESFAKKGLSKIDPRLGEFVNKAQNEGFEFNEIKDFLTQKIDKSVKQEKNIIEQYSPELHQFMTDSVRSGENPIRAAALAIFDKKKNFEPIIRKMEKEHNTPWTAIVESIYGKEGSQKTPNQPENQQQQQTNQGGQQTQNGKWGEIKQGIMDVLNS